jgi:hypothetical protein
MITEEVPTTIVKDFETFINYVATNNVKVTKASEYITRKDLKAIYAIMCEPKLSVSEKGNQPDYPLIHLFFHLGLTLDLVRIVSSKSGAVFAVNAERIAIYKSLTPTEKFVSHLIAFWIDVDWEKIQEGYYKHAPQNIDFLFELLGPFPASEKIKMNKVKHLKQELFQFEHFLYYFSYFGLWHVTIDEENSHQPGRTKHKLAKTIELTPFYKWVEEILLETWEPFVTNHDKAGFEFLSMMTGIQLEEEEEDVMTKEERKELFITLVKQGRLDGDLNQVLTKKEHVFQEGSYHFIVKEDGGRSRTLQLDGAQTLFDLHREIQKAFDLFDDHLYSFYMDGKKYSKHCYNSPRDFAGPFVQEGKIGDLSLYEGKRFLYLYDFGAEWEFNIDVVRVVPVRN